MTDRDVFVAKVRDAINSRLAENVDGWIDRIDTRDLAEAAVAAMAEHIGPPF